MLKAPTDFDSFYNHFNNTCIAFSSGYFGNHI